MGILDDAEGHFNAVREHSELKIDVPEWGENGTTLFVRRGTSAQKEKFFMHFRNGEYLKAQIWLIIKRCLTADGTRAFPNEQSAFKRLYEKADPNVLIRIAGEISDFDAEESIDIKTAEKN